MSDTSKKPITSAAKEKARYPFLLQDVAKKIGEAKALSQDKDWLAQQVALVEEAKALAKSFVEEGMNHEIQYHLPCCEPGALENDSCQQCNINEDL